MKYGLIDDNGLFYFKYNEHAKILKKFQKLRINRRTKVIKNIYKRSKS